MHTHYALSVTYIVVHLLALCSLRQVNGARQVTMGVPLHKGH